MEHDDAHQDDQFWDEHSQMWLSRSGVSRLRDRLRERRAERAEHPETYVELRERLRLGPAANA